MKLAHVRPVEWVSSRPGSFASLIRGDSPEGCRVALIGLPDDTGVQLNKGMPGAAMGPQAFRAALARYGASYTAGQSQPEGDDVP